MTDHWAFSNTRDSKVAHFRSSDTAIMSWCGKGYVDDIRDWITDPARVAMFDKCMSCLRWESRLCGESTNSQAVRSN